MPNARRGNASPSPPRNMGYSRTRRCPRTRCRRYLRVHNPSGARPADDPGRPLLTRGGGIAPAAVFAARRLGFLHPVVPLLFVPRRARAARGWAADVVGARRELIATAVVPVIALVHVHARLAVAGVSRGTLSTLVPVARRREVEADHAGVAGIIRASILVDAQPAAEFVPRGAIAAHRGARRLVHRTRS